MQEGRAVAEPYAVQGHWPMAHGGCMGANGPWGPMGAACQLTSCCRRSRPVLGRPWSKAAAAGSMPPVRARVGVALSTNMSTTAAIPAAETLAGRGGELDMRVCSRPTAGVQGHRGQSGGHHGAGWPSSGLLFWPRR
jgi:hypothetical protein